MNNKLNAAMDTKKSLLCVGLDSEYEKLPVVIKNEKYPQFTFNKEIIDATHKYVVAYKPNIAFYEARGERGMSELKMTMDYLHDRYSDIFTICDAKRADIGNTNKGYVNHIFDYLGFDAITLHPYLGSEALKPFLERKDKVSIILCRTSNKGAGELQDLMVEGKPLYMHVARMVSERWNTNKNCMLVVGATYPEEMRQIRSVVGDMTFLVPGIGAQGGEVKSSVEAGQNSKKKGMIINSARGIIFASTGDDFVQKAADEAKSLNEEINKYR